MPPVSAVLPLPKVPPVVPWALWFVGAGLVYGAIRNQSPRDLLRSILTPGQTAAVRPLDPVAAAQAAGAGGQTVDAGGGGGGGGGVGARSDGPAAVDIARYALVAVKNGPYASKVYMAAPMAGAYLAWQRAYGAPIPLTGAWRSEAEQAAQHASNPDRFGASSYHTKGLALDVDNGWLGGLSAADQTRLRKAAKTLGFGQARYKRGEAGCGKAASGASTDNDEPWHFSYGGCG